MNESFIDLEFDESISTREKLSTDASIFSVLPKGVFYPKSALDVASLVKKISNGTQGESLTVRAAGTCMSGGPLNEGFIVDTTKYMTDVVRFDIKNKTITVESGTQYKTVEKICSASNLLFPPYTSSKDVCTIGGMIGNNASGELSVRYGATIDWVESVDIVLSDGLLYTFKELTKSEWFEKQKLQNQEGVIYRKIASILDQYELDIDEYSFRKSIPKVVKNAAGYQVWRVYNPKTQTYNLSRLFVAAQGTLGIITTATLRLTEIPKYRRVIACALQDLRSLGKVLVDLRACNPESIETYDSHTYELAKQEYPKEALLVSPVSENAKLTVFIQVAEDTEGATVLKQQEIETALRSHQVQPFVPDNKETVDALFTIRRASFRMLKELKNTHSRVAPCVEDTIIPVAVYGEFIERLEMILREYNFVYTYAGHIGDGSIRLVPLVDFSKVNTPEVIMEFSHKVYDLAIELGGSIGVDHNDGLLKTHYLEKQYGPRLVRMFKEIKDFFDPRYMFNPGKKVPTDRQGTEEYAKAHMHKSNA